MIDSDVKYYLLSISADCKPLILHRMSQDYKIGDCVWVKLKGFPHWPARVDNIDKNKYTVSINSYNLWSCLLNFTTNPFLNPLFYRCSILVPTRPANKRRKLYLHSLRSETSTRSTKEPAPPSSWRACWRRRSILMLNHRTRFLASKLMLRSVPHFSSIVVTDI